MTTQTAQTTWYLKGDAIGACNCDNGCPCTFNAPPSHGSCEGAYVLHINEGRFGEVPLDGRTISFFAHSPAALHLGNLTHGRVFDDGGSPAQRQALLDLTEGKHGGVFGVFAGLTTKWIEPLFVPTEWKPGGGESYAKMGDVVECQLTPIKNPVTGVPSPFIILLGNGFLTDRMEIYTTTTYRVNHPELKFEHPEKFGETFKFHWSGNG